MAPTTQTSPNLTFCLGPHLYYVRKRDWVGGVRKMAIFSDVQYCICADKVGRWGLKRPKICWRNIGMVPFTKRAHFIRRTLCLCVTILTGIFVASQAKYLYWESIKHTIKGHFSYFLWNHVVFWNSKYEPYSNYWPCNSEEKKVRYEVNDPRQYSFCSFWFTAQPVKAASFTFCIHIW